MSCLRPNTTRQDQVTKKGGGVRYLWPLVLLSLSEAAATAATEAAPSGEAEAAEAEAPMEPTEAEAPMEPETAEAEAPMEPETAEGLCLCCCLKDLLQTVLSLLQLLRYLKQLLFLNSLTHVITSR